MKYRAGSINNGASITTYRGFRIGSSALIGDLSNKSIQIIGVVVDMLDPSIRKSNRVATFTHTSSIIRLCSLEVGVGVVISHSIVVCVGRHLISIYLSSSMGDHRTGGILRSSRDGCYQAGNVEEDLHPVKL